MSNGLAHQRVLRTVRLLPQAVKIGILESEIKQSGTKPSPAEPKPSKPEKTPAPQPKVQICTQEQTREIEELTAQVKALTNSLSNAEVKNLELNEAKTKLESEIDSVKADYQQRKKQLESENASNASRSGKRKGNHGRPGTWI